MDATREQVEDLRSAAAQVVTAIETAGRALPAPAMEAVARLRAAVAATPTTTVQVPMGQPDPDGWVVTPAKASR